MRTLISAVAILALVGSAAFAAEQPPAEQILFVCERGNVKSLMAASYFNQLAAQRGLPWRAVSRGIAPDSTTAPKRIAAALLAEGVDVSEFRPVKVDATDAAEAVRIVMIGTDLPARLGGDEQRIERWNDVPPATTSYDAARSSLKAHIADLLERLSLQSAGRQPDRRN
jgi:protein-tyrosine-phosphatase